MKQQEVTHSQGLKDAFNLFNQVSEQLASTYHHLENRIGQLNNELAAAGNERLIQLAEKERLANRLERLLDALPAGVVVIDGNGIVQQYNSCASNLIGELAIGFKWYQVIEQAFSASGNGDEATLKDGRIVSISTSPLGEEPGQIILLKNVTETRALQEMLNRHQRLSTMGEMSASLAHQIRTPLASSLLYISHLRQSQMSAHEYQRCVDKILSRLRHLDCLVNDMMVFAKGSHAGTDEINVTCLLQELQQITEPQLAANNCALKISGDTCGIRLRGNYATLLSVMQNLLLNAIQACTENNPHLQPGTVTIIAGKDPDNKGIKTVLIQISDNGPGIPVALQQRIFEPFFTTKPQGTGLGLAVAQAVIHAHNGTLWIDSKSDIGTTVGIRLPILHDEDDMDIVI